MGSMKATLGDALVMPDLFTIVDRPPPASSYPDGIPPEVCDLFERISLQVRAQGFDRYSARAVLHRIRWHYQIDKGDREWKCNDHWTPPLARWFLARHPECGEFFETRNSPQTGETR